MTCVVNCKEENMTRPGVWWNQILQVENAETERIVYVRYACMHCDDPPCVKACPNQAIYQRPDGIVLVDKNRCAGVGACAEACPYDVIVMTPDTDYFPGRGAPWEAEPAAHRVHPPGKASMCTLCFHRIDEGLQPICVSGCPSRAMVFGDLDDTQSPIREKRERSQAMHTEAGSKPKVTYLFPPGLREFVEERVGDNPHMAGISQE
jgi:molybdopterin-containing oxidoreductase family iron-sulfur binding subunit